MPDEFETEQTATREEAAAVLRALADGVAAGTVAFDDGPNVALPATVDLELEFEREDDDRSLEVELEWSADEEPGETGDEATAADVEDSDVSAADTETADVEAAPVGPADPPESLARFELFTDRSGEWRWRLVHRNGNVVATSGEGYTRKHNARKGLRSVVRNAPGAEVVEDATDDE